MNFWVVIYRFSWILLAVLCIIVVIALYTPKIRNQSQLQKRKAELKEETRQLRADIDDLASKQERFRTDPEFVEHVAKEVGMARTNVVIIKYTDE